MFAALLRRLHRRGLVPQVSETERAALEAGDVWIDAELFSGRPDLRRIVAEPYPALSAAERAFLDGPVEEVCASVDLAELERTRELSPRTWELLRRHRLFGLGLPERWGGHGFSALAQSTIFGKLSSRAPVLGTVVLIPNSVGPGELLVAVGTEAQRARWLPRLARGEEIPCFALTEPEAGSDAASIRSRGVAFRADDGSIKIRLDFEKRYITLAPIATLIGLAFRLEDPEELLGKGRDVGITCALVPADRDGVESGGRHDPLGVPFPNGPIRGRGVVIDVDEILGGPAHAGDGWRMLMEALSGGRAISLPAQAVAAGKWIARVAGAYSIVRRQFGTPVGRFEGVEEPLARIAGLVYLMEAARVFTCGAVDAGHRPAVVSAIMKLRQTELARELAADGMDVLGGAAICLGPRNLLARAWIGAPIGITVEGANVLTRTLIVFGQGALRCHPHLGRLFAAMREGDTKGFRSALFAQSVHFVRNLLRSARLLVSGGRLTRSPVAGPTADLWRRLAWASTRFAVAADLALFFVGPALKRRGKLGGRFADLLSWLTLAAAALRRHEAEGRRGEDLPLVRWAAEHALHQAQEAYEGVLRNLDVPVVGAVLRGPGLLLARLAPFGRPPSDRLGGPVADAIRRPGEQRDRLTAGLYRPPEATHPLLVLERAFALAVDAEPVLATIRRASRAGGLPAGDPESLVDDAVAAGVIDAAAAELVLAAVKARHQATAVDVFAPANRVAAAEREPALAAG